METALVEILHLQLRYKWDEIKWIQKVSSSLVYFVHKNTYKESIITDTWLYCLFCFLGGGFLYTVYVCSMAITVGIFFRIKMVISQTWAFLIFFVNQDKSQHFRSWPGMGTGTHGYYPDFGYPIPHIISYWHGRQKNKCKDAWLVGELIKDI